MKLSSSKILPWLGFFLVFLVGVGVFQSNRLGTAEYGFFVTFDRFSQALVTGNIIAHDAGVADKTWNLGFATVNDSGERSDNLWVTYVAAVKNNAVEKVTHSPYVSQYGIQGVIFLGLHNLFGINEIAGLHLFNSIAFSLVITALAFLFARTYDWRFGALFFLVMIGSPWVVSFARNLYWVPFTWFLPAVFAALTYLAKDTRQRALGLFGVGAAVFLKSLAGYEYLSNVTLFACSVFVIAPFFRTQDRRHWFNFQLGCLAFIACVLGFACALLIHAGMRGDTIAQGLVNILEQDVKRRTYGDPSHFDPILRESLTASISDVLIIYWTRWISPVVAGIPKEGLNVATLFILVGLVWSLIRKQAVGLKVLSVLVVYFLASISWLVVAKAHSYVHTQLNFVLWYFGFIQALAYGVVALAVPMLRDLLAKTSRRGRMANRTLVGVAVVCLLVAAGFNHVARIERFEKRIDARMADAVATVDVGNGFKVLFLNDRKAMLVKPECSDFNASAMFMLHVYPADPQAAVADLDFKWSDRDIPAAWFSKYSNTCMATLPRFDYKIKSLQLGQYELGGNQGLQMLWEGGAKLEGVRYFDSLTASDFTDVNWDKGVSRTVPEFFIPNNFLNRQSLAVGDVLKAGNAQPRTIRQIAYSEDFINVYFDGTVLDPRQSGFPNIIEILSN
ncbi:hypothetical protein PS627_04510 [Pseudomonas fluorescens]|uniref:hypothetical protein n=1 Tax=Pseudomonas fluorescens TaxID=294 RepID=UPI0012599B97|nr:hypothetical protein [Pseudomonas fluorescens]CAG8871562.1 hypothetical protein PS627_04510 [Pseudomonas fluorescens]